MSPSTQVLFGVVVVPAVIGLVQVAKEAGVPSRLAPLIAIGLGILAGVAQWQAAHQPWIQAAVIGIALGLSAVGLYSGASNFFPGVSSTPAPEAVRPATPPSSTPQA